MNFSVVENLDEETIIKEYSFIIENNSSLTTTYTWYCNNDSSCILYTGSWCDDGKGYASCGYNCSNKSGSCSGGCRCIGVYR